jgi:hypothetical protein
MDNYFILDDVTEEKAKLEEKARLDKEARLGNHPCAPLDPADQV